MKNNYKKTIVVFGCTEKEEITPDNKKLLKRLQRKLELFVRGWNEQELREKVIAHLVEAVDFDMYDIEIGSFSEREMKAVYKGNIIQGKVEWMVANGLFEPQRPFFFIHEYKREKHNSDPVGQLLATLYAAQILNNQEVVSSNLFQNEAKTFKQISLYGVYIMGRFWFFARLKESKYYISKAYDSTNMEHLEFIFKVLKAQKKMIIRQVEELNVLKP